MLHANTSSKQIQQNPVNTDTKGTCQNVRIIGVSVLSGLSGKKSRTYLLLTEFEGRTVKYGESFFLPKKRGSIFHSTDRENEFNKIFMLFLRDVNQISRAVLSNTARKVDQSQRLS